MPGFSKCFETKKKTQTFFTSSLKYLHGHTCRVPGLIMKMIDVKYV